jgi:hypothetical protein
MMPSIAPGMRYLGGWNNAPLAAANESVQQEIFSFDNNF